MLLAETIVETHKLLERYALLIQALPNHERLEKTELLVPEFRLHHDSQLDVYYAPFDYVNETAKVMLLGITPGWTQMEIAYRNARQDLLDGLATSEVCRRAKKQASFAGSMRKNITAMLDDLGLPSLLGIPSSASLFSEHRGLLHTSSAIRYPVFVHGRNYTGHSPQILDTPALRWFIDKVLVEELWQVPQAVIIPLGRSVSTVLEYLADKKSIERDRCLLGFPHPSGANGHRVREFEEYRGKLAKQLETQLSRDIILPEVECLTPASSATAARERL